MNWFTFYALRFTPHIIPGMLKPCVTLPISSSEIFFACSSAWLAARRIMSSSICASDGFKAAGSILMEASVPLHFATTFTAPPPLVPLERREEEARLFSQVSREEEEERTKVGGGGEGKRDKAKVMRESERESKRETKSFVFIFLFSWDKERHFFFLF